MSISAQQAASATSWLSLLVWIVIPAANFLLFRSISQRHAMESYCSEQASVKVTDFAVVDDARAKLVNNVYDRSSTNKASISGDIGADIFTEPCPTNSNSNSNSVSNILTNSAAGVDVLASNLNFVHSISSENCGKFGKFRNYNLEFIDPKEFDQWRAETLASMQYPFHTSILSLDHTPTADCRSYDSFYTDLSGDTCSIVVFVNDTNVPYPSLRYDEDVNEAGISTKNPWHHSDGTLPKAFSNEHNTNYFWRPTGTFRKLPREKGRDRLKEKMFPLLQNFEGQNGIAKQTKLKLSSSGFKKGDDIVVMVVNEGEIDLFLNFACSCKQHGISMKNVLVFAGSEELIYFIEISGAMGLYHPAYGAVSKRASHDYLDRVFVDMMWYKCFSIFLVLRLGLNVLFQDVDLVWFRDPFPYFHGMIHERQNRSMVSGSHLEAFYSDDGQRSLRYAPYYANSGFYYYIASERSLYLSWAIMLAFDNVQLLGSHQNVMTTRLVEGISVSHQHAKIMNYEDFPNGYQFHHERGYMKKFKAHQIEPYNFHMCWTQGKPDKLKYMREVDIWYLQEICSPLENVIPGGSVYENSRLWRNLPQESKWRSLSNFCCKPAW